MNHSGSLNRSCSAVVVIYSFFFISPPMFISKTTTDTGYSAHILITYVEANSRNEVNGASNSKVSFFVRCPSS